MESYIGAMSDVSSVQNTFFEYSPYQTRDMDPDEFSNVVAKLREELKKYDILHIQHEFGFFHSNQLQKLIDTAKSLDKKVVVSYHTSPDLVIISKPLGGIGPRSIIRFLRDKRHYQAMRRVHIKPLLKADVVIIHNEYARGQLSRYGLSPNKITLNPLPTPLSVNVKQSDFIAKQLHRKPRDVIYGTVGYIHRFKGVDAAIKALRFLPDNYKLAIMGGVKADSNEQKLYDKIADLIVSLGLEDRVYITGFVKDDDLLNSYVHECDLLVYPYKSEYYKGVSSAALNLGLANSRPIIAYPVDTFKETNIYHQLVFTHNNSYYELAREIRNIDMKKQIELVRKYAQDNSFANRAQNLTSIYQSLE
jgi:glycosyltransferase involved in cell wall biosynthesis